MQTKKAEDFLVVEKKEQVIHIKLKGFWADDIISDHKAHFLEAIPNAIRSMNGKPFVVIADLRDFKHPTEEAKKIIGSSMEFAKENGIVKAIEVIDQSLLKMSMDKTAKGKLGDNRMVVASMEEATTAAYDAI